MGRLPAQLKGLRCRFAGILAAQHVRENPNVGNVKCTAVKALVGEKAHVVPAPARMKGVITRVYINCTQLFLLTMLIASACIADILPRCAGYLWAELQACEDAAEVSAAIAGAWLRTAWMASGIGLPS